MGERLENIAKELVDSEKSVHLIYAFNGTGKTRLSKMVKEEVKKDSETKTRDKILYYNAFTEDLFYWDNDLGADTDFKLNIQHNSFIHWIIEEQGQDQNIIANFQRYTDDKLTPHFDLSNQCVTFSYRRGNEEDMQLVKLSKGEESNFVWSVFYTLLELVINELKIAEPDDRSVNDFDELKYVFIDDPVSSLDENHLIEVASNLAHLIKESNKEKLGLKFIITTHNPLFYNVLHNELRSAKKYRLEKLEDGTYKLHTQQNDSPFSYHLFLRQELNKAIREDNIRKYHFNSLRNLLEKTSTFLGYSNWNDLIFPDETEENRSSYQKRIIELSSHSKYATEESTELNPQHKKLLGRIFKDFEERYHFHKEE